jgi:hypothetical protein
MNTRSVITRFAIAAALVATGFAVFPTSNAGAEVRDHRTKGQGAWNPSSASNPPPLARKNTKVYPQVVVDPRRPNPTKSAPGGVVVTKGTANPPGSAGPPPRRR